MEKDRCDEQIMMHDGIFVGQAPRGHPISIISVRSRHGYSISKTRLNAQRCSVAEHTAGAIWSCGHLTRYGEPRIQSDSQFERTLLEISLSLYIEVNSAPLRSTRRKANAPKQLTPTFSINTPPCSFLIDFPLFERGRIITHELCYSCKSLTLFP